MARHASKKIGDREDSGVELSDADVTRLLSDPAFRSKIDALLAEAETRGGETPSEQVFAELRARHGL
ncbi:MAG: hypothetical protein KF694_09465 [Mesorhizobium sp.]|nr:hypothetical protein [Mesorhizobium sp.]